MKRFFYINILVCSLYLFLVGCTKQTTPEPLDFAALHPKIGSDEYYEALRSYKKSDHAIAFGWWGGSGGGNGITSDMTTRYLGLPDSMDIVSLWGSIPTDTAVQNEMQLVRKQKGTKFTMVLFGSGVDQLRLKTFPKLDVLTGIDSVAKSISDTVNKYQLDGFDLDYEPNYGDGGIFGHGGGGTDAGGDVYTQRLMKALSKYMGPASNSNLILLIDGEYEFGIFSYVDYIVLQTYAESGSGFTVYQNRFNLARTDNVSSKKIVLTENMQRWGAKGASLIYNGLDIGTVLGMATFNPTQGRKGGFGAYIMEMDAKSMPPETYYYMRKGIQIQNPAPY